MSKKVRARSSKSASRGSHRAHSAMTEPDKWSRWLAETRFGGDQKAAELQLRHLTALRKRLLKKAGLSEGKVVLDVGSGERLVWFAALELVRTTWRMIFSD